MCVCVGAKWEGISLISKLRGLLEMNAAFLWRVMVLVCNMVSRYGAYITQHSALCLLVLKQI